MHFNLWVDIIDDKAARDIGQGAVSFGQWMPLCDVLSSLAPKRTTEASEVTCAACKTKLVDARLTR